MESQTDSTDTHTMIRILGSTAIGCLGAASKGTRASDGSNATIAPRLGFPHMHRRDTSKDVKAVKKSPSHVAYGSIPATVTKLLETLTRTTAHMTELDAKPVEKDGACNRINVLRFGAVSICLDKLRQNLVGFFGITVFF
jgi:hypothetical protein